MDAYGCSLHEWSVRRRHTRPSEVTIIDFTAQTD